MHTYRYCLQPYNGGQTRYYCPGCNHRTKTFTRYIDNKTGLHLHPTVGKCSRLDNCAYHLSPAEYFKSNPSAKPIASHSSQASRRGPWTMDYGPNSTIPQHIFRQSLIAYRHNYFINYLIRMFGKACTTRLVERYYIGTANHWPGSTVFWQLDSRGQVRTGKVMLYNDDGKRVKQPFNHVQWAHSLLRSKNEEKDPGRWTMDHGQKSSDFHLKQCLFGEHLLINDKNSIIALAESEKTAIIASVFMPQYLWLATGGLCNLNTAICRVLKGRTVILYPDLNAMPAWRHKAELINSDIIDINIIIDDTIEDAATPQQRQQGWDIADYLLLWSGRTGEFCY